MVYFVCIFSFFRVFCIKVSRRRKKTVLIPQTNFPRLWHGKKKSLTVCLEMLQDYTAKDFSLFAVLTTADFYSHNSQFHFYRTIQTT